MEFEVHAGSPNRRPSDFLFLDNGRSLHDIMKIFLKTPLVNLEGVVLKAVGSFTIKKSKFCVNCRGL